jgi:outer membrane lipoprotein LolB
MRMQRTSRVGLVCLLLGLLAGCTTVRSVSESEDWAARRAALLLMDSWSLKGRVAIKSDSDGGQARLRWQQAGDSSRIHLAGPFGAGAYDLVWEPEFVSVTDAAGEQSVRYQGAAAGEQFLHDRLGWAFPAGSLRYWILGVLDPRASGQEHFDAAGVLADIEQHGWRVSYDRFSDHAGYVMPTRINVENDRARLRIVISEWSLAEGSDG